MENTLNLISRMMKGTMGEALGIEVHHAEPGLIRGSMPVDQRTVQPMGLLHGGASAALAETLGSIGSHMLVKDDGKQAVGLEINANHLRSARSGKVYAEARLIHKGGKIHVWQIDISDEAHKQVCTSRLTVMII